jgi:hypothetical protein
MEGLNLTPLLIALAALIIGWAIGFFDSNNRAAAKIRQAEARAEHAARLADEKVADLAARAPAPAPVTDGSTPALLRLLTYEDRLLLDMDGVRVDTGALSSVQRKRLIELLTLMRPWLEGGPAAPSVAQPRAAASAPPVSAAARPPSIARPVPAPESKEEKVIAPLSMVGQIDTILQARMVNTPLAGRGIRLQESPEGGVIVYVGVQKFPTIDDVTDPRVQSAIRSAIAEWEATFTPGI